MATPSHRAYVRSRRDALTDTLHKLWRAGRPGAYYVEYGYSCMGYEIAVTDRRIGAN